MDSTQIYQAVQERYGKHAISQTNSDLEHNQKIAEAFGYSLEELTSIPDGANLGVSCGNPLATAKLQEGEVIIDLGSGAGFDVFLAAHKVGPTGKAIGIDMNKQMLALARTNAQKSHTPNTSFIEASITSIPLPPSTADCIISNCVINLVPAADKHLVFREMFRLLKPGGRISISDILAKTELPRGIRDDMALYVGCIAGASRVGEYEAWLKGAGFEQTLIVGKGSDLNVYAEGTLLHGDAGGGVGDGVCCSSGCCGAVSVSGTVDAASACCSSSCCGGDKSNKTRSGGTAIQYDLNEWVGSFQIYAVKPAFTQV